MWKVAVLWLVGCGGSDCEPPILCGPDFTLTCGNDIRDECFEQAPEMACSSEGGTFERCDGADVMPCSSMGYYDGTPRCISCKTLDTTACRACASDVAACDLIAAVHAAKVVVGESRIAVLGRGTISLFEGTTFRTHAVVPSVEDVIAVPGGFLVAAIEPPRLHTLTFDGTLGPARPLPASRRLRLAYGGGVVLVAWFTTGAPANTVTTAIADLTGAIVVAPRSLAQQHSEPLAVASDGTSFFLAYEKQVVRIAPDNTSTIAAGFPLSVAPLSLHWDGANGWYVAGEMIQRFGADGAAVGPAFAINNLTAAAPGRDALLVLAQEGRELVLRRVSATMTTIAGPVGVAREARAALGQVGEQVFAAWDMDETTRVALVPAP